jgi:hypothetical protein
MLYVERTTDGYLAEVQMPGYTQEFERWARCPLLAGKKAIASARRWAMKQPQNCRDCNKPLTTDIDRFRGIHGACLPRPSERPTQAETETRPIFGEAADDDRPT